MFGSKRTEALVVGAGPVGLFAALVLQRHGAAVRILDREERTGTHSYALALHPATLELFEEFGLLDAVLERARLLREIRVYDGRELRATIPVGSADRRHPSLAVLRQADLERILENALRAADVHVEWCHAAVLLETRPRAARVRIDRRDKESLGYAVQREGWIVTSQREMQVPFVLACDGIHSPMRRALEIDYEECGPAADFAVFEFETDMQLGDAMHLVLEEDRVSVCWPMPGRHCRWSFQIPVTGEEHEERKKDRYFGQIGTGRFPLLDTAHLRAFLAERAPWFQGSVQEPRWCMQVRFERRLATSFGRDRVWLVGDAAHATGPAGVQSMNVGLAEARELADLSFGVLCGTRFEEVLTEHAARRREEWRQLLGHTGLPEPLPGTEPWIAAQVEKLLPSLPASGEALAGMLATLGLRWPPIAAIDQGSA